MMDSLYIAWRYVLYHSVKTVTLAAAIVVITLLPAALQVVVDEGEKQLSARADRTPLLIGARGSALDLVMNSLYFSTHRPDPIAYRDAQLDLTFFIMRSSTGDEFVARTLSEFDQRMMPLFDEMFRISEAYRDVLRSLQKRLKFVIENPGKSDPAFEDKRDAMVFVVGFDHVPGGIVVRSDDHVRLPRFDQTLGFQRLLADGSRGFEALGIHVELLEFTVPVQNAAQAPFDPIRPGISLVVRRDE